MKFTTSSTRRIGSVLVLHRWSKAATWLVTGPKYLKSFVPPEISMHRMKLFTLFTSAILFYREDWKRFVRFDAARKDVEKVKLWRTGAWLSVEGYSAELYISPPEREIHKIFACVANVPIPAERNIGSREGVFAFGTRGKWGENEKKWKEVGGRGERRVQVMSSVGFLLHVKVYERPGSSAQNQQTFCC